MDARKASSAPPPPGRFPDMNASDPVPSEAVDGIDAGGACSPGPKRAERGLNVPSTLGAARSQSAVPAVPEEVGLSPYDVLFKPAEVWPPNEPRPGTSQEERVVAARAALTADATQRQDLDLRQRAVELQRITRLPADRALQEAGSRPSRLLGEAEALLLVSLLAFLNRGEDPESRRILGECAIATDAFDGAGKLASKLAMSNAKSRTARTPARLTPTQAAELSACAVQAGDFAKTAMEALGRCLPVADQRRADLGSRMRETAYVTLGDIENAVGELRTALEETPKETPRTQSAASLAEVGANLLRHLTERGSVAEAAATLAEHVDVTTKLVHDLKAHTRTVRKERGGSSKKKPKKAKKAKKPAKTPKAEEAEKQEAPEPQAVRPNAPTAGEQPAEDRRAASVAVRSMSAATFGPAGDMDAKADSLAWHFDKHGAEVGCDTPDDYVARGLELARQGGSENATQWSQSSFFGPRLTCVRARARNPHTHQFELQYVYFVGPADAPLLVSFGSCR